MSTPPLSAHDLRAAAEAHRELSPEYSDEVVDSFLEKVEARLDARMEARLAELMPPRKRLLGSLNRDQRRSLGVGAAMGVGAVGVFVGYVNTYSSWDGGHHTLWPAVLATSAAICGAGIARMFRYRQR
jgi:hypothetical protein